MDTTCRSCGTANREVSLYCKGCGEPVGAGTRQQAPAVVALVLAVVGMIVSVGTGAWAVDEGSLWGDDALLLLVLGSAVGILLLTSFVLALVSLGRVRRGARRRGSALATVALVICFLALHLGYFLMVGTTLEQADDRHYDWQRVRDLESRLWDLENR